ncbi:MAG: hypothetical protein M3O31_13600 [Acidobacteriota bacterium]|nr:hypothetical protein [Acidobacteriota bacterium]
MKTKIVLLFFLCSTASSLSQAPVVLFADAPCCLTVWKNGKASYVIRDANVTIIISGPSNYSASLYSVEVAVRQDGDIPLDVNPATFSVVASDPNHSVLPYLDMDARAAKDRKHDSLLSGIMVGLAAAASGAAAASPQTATVNNSDGTSSTVTYTDPNAQANANAQAEENGRLAVAGVAAKYTAQTAGLLRRNTLHKDETVSGTVYFQGPKTMKATKHGFTPLESIDIPINGTIYRFQ